MSRLHAELARLYTPDDAFCRQRPVAADGEAAWGNAVGFSAAIVERLVAGSDEAALQLGGAGGGARVLAIEFNCAARSRDWPHVAALYQALQDELELPAPALAVRAHAGYALWISLAQPLPLTDAAAFLTAVRERYLAELPVAAVTLRPGEATDADAALLPLLPARHAASGHWSAFIDPGLGALFADEPWLEMAPNAGQQADILAPLKSVDAAALAHAREVLAAQETGGGDSGTTPEAMPAAVDDVASAGVRRQSQRLALGGGYTDPADFLMALMNDPSASARQRIAAAKALLPYHHRRKT